MVKAHDVLVRILTTITSNIDLPLDRYVILNIPAAGEGTLARGTSGQGVGVVCKGSGSFRSFVALWRVFGLGLLACCSPRNDEQRGKKKIKREKCDQITRYKIRYQ